MAKLTVATENGAPVELYYEDLGVVPRWCWCTGGRSADVPGRTRSRPSSRRAIG